MENQKRTLIRHFHPTPPISTQFRLFSFFSFFPIPPLDAPAMCSLRCAHTPTPRCYVLTTLRAYAPPAPLFRSPLNTLRSPLDAPAMCSLRCAHTPTPRCYVLTSLRAYAPPAPLFRSPLNTLRSFFQRAPSYL